MKKKFFSLLAVAVFSAGLMSVSPNVETLEEDGRASDCARMARATVLELADAYGQDPNGLYFDYFIGIYHNLYEDCYNN